MVKTEFVTFLVVAFCIVLLFLSGIVIFFIIIKNRKKEQLQNEKLMQESYVRKLNEEKLIAQRETMDEIGKELHDNIAQQLVLISMAAFSKKIDGTTINKLVNQCIEEIRMLSKTLIDQKFSEYTMSQLLYLEKEKIENYSSFNIEINIDNQFDEINTFKLKSTIMRVFQEFIQNSLKHSKGDKITFKGYNENENRVVEISDNGVGFENNDSNSKGIGVKNISNRLNNIAEQIQYITILGSGVLLKFNLKNENDKK